MDTGPNKFQTKIQGILKKVKSVQFRSQVAEWQKLLAATSSRFGVEVLTSNKEASGSVNEEDKLSVEEGSECPDESPPNEERDVDLGNSSPSGTCDTCVLATQNNPTDFNGMKPSQLVMEVGEGNSEVEALMLLETPKDVRPRDKSPVQQWVDSLPPHDNSRREEDMPTESEDNDTEVENLTLGAEAPGVVCPIPFPFVQISSCAPPCGSDAGSHCSSMESLLEARKPDPEEILMELGFGGSEEPDNMSRIPSRFLHPSNMKGVAIDDFLRHQKDLVQTFQSGFSGYRGLTGPSHTIPSGIVGKIMERLREAEVGKETNSSSPKLAKVAHNLLTKLKCVRESVLSPDNRKWLQNQGDKSPEPSTRRIIIGHQSFTFSQDGNLIEAPPSEKTESVSLKEEESDIVIESEEVKDLTPTRAIKSLLRDHRLKEESILEEIEDDEEEVVNLDDKDALKTDDQTSFKNDERPSPLLVTVENLPDENLPVKKLSIENIVCFKVDKDDGGVLSSGTDEMSSSTTEVINSLDRCESNYVNFNSENSFNVKNDKESGLNTCKVISLVASKSFDEEQLELKYKSIMKLVELLKDSSPEISIGSEEDYYNFSSEDRRDLEVKMIETALAVYQARMSEMNLRPHWKDLLTAQLDKVINLLENNQSPSDLSNVIKQMTNLLRHQESLKDKVRIHSEESGIS